MFCRNVQVLCSCFGFFGNKVENINPPINAVNEREAIINPPNQINQILEDAPAPAPAQRRVKNTKKRISDLLKFKSESKSAKGKEMNVYIRLEDEEVNATPRRIYARK